MKLLTRQNRYDSLFEAYAEAHGIDWRLMKAQAIAESALDPRAISRVGAEGLTQFMPATWRDVAGDQADPFNPEHAICAQATYMAQLMKLFPGHIAAALAAYNCGMGRVQSLMRKHGDAWLSAAPTETRAYVARIQELRRSMGA